MSTAALIALQIELERSMRNRDDALAIRLIQRMREENRKPVVPAGAV